MGERMGPNTIAALHAGADQMVELYGEAVGAPSGDGGGGGGGSGSDNDDDDEYDFDDEGVLAALREARLADIHASQAAKTRFGAGVKLIAKQDWQREVVDMSASGDAGGEGTWVVVHLQHEATPLCAAVGEALDTLARRQPAASFVQIAAGHCMPAEHFHLLPALFCYRAGELAARLISGELVGPEERPTPDGLEWRLAELGVLATALEERPRPERAPRPPRRRGRGGCGGDDDGGSSSGGDDGGGGGDNGDEDYEEPPDDDYEGFERNV